MDVLRRSEGGKEIRHFTNKIILTNHIDDVYTKMTAFGRTSFSTGEVSAGQRHIASGRAT